MGTGTSLLSKIKSKDSQSNVSANKLNDTTTVLDVNEYESATKLDESLIGLPKSVLALKIIQLQKQLDAMENPMKRQSHNMENQSNCALIPRSVFSHVDSIGSETIKAKDVLISQLERELRAQTRVFENEKLQSKRKIEKYAAEITELRFKSNQQIAKLENELQSIQNSNGLIENRSSGTNSTSPLILKLSQKLNEQAETIKELELSISRKDEIIEGFKLFEATHYGTESLTEKNTAGVSSNTHSFVHKELMMLESNRPRKNLSVSDESWFSQETLTPISSENQASKTKILPINSSITDQAKHLVGLPTNLIIDSPKFQSNSQDMDD